MKPKTPKQAQVSEEKKKVVKSLSDLIKNKKTILIASIKNIPASQFQAIGKKLRKIAVVKVPKKNLIFRAINSSENPEIKKLEEKIDDSFALLFSDIDAFELASELIKNKRPAKAKAGQIAPEDIEIPAGPTDLPPGPAISELGSVGLQVQIENGKITIKAPRVIVKKGEKISSQASDIMSKLDIKPFSIGFTPLCAFDNETKTFYPEINIDAEGTLKNLLYAYSRALPFAVSIGYSSKDTISFLIGKAGAHAKKINRIMTGEPEPEMAAQPSGAAESPKEETKSKSKEEEQADAGAGLASLF